MLISVVILNWNGAKFLSEYLPSVVKHSASVEGCEVVVADNGSTDNSLEILQNNFPTVRVISLDKNYGFTGGYNLAIKECDAKYIMLLNSDVLTSEGYLNPLIKTMESDKSVGVVMPKILSLSEPEKFEYAGAGGGFVDIIGLPYCRGRILSSIEEDQGQYDDTIEVAWASGAAMMIRRDLFDELKGFDNDFFAHMEEIDLCWRAKNSGFKILYVGSSHIFHLGGGTLDNNSPYKLYLNFRNSLFMLFKNLSFKALLPTLFLRMCFDGFVAIIYLLQGSFSKFKSVFNAHIDFYASLRSLAIKRDKIDHNATNFLRGFLPLIAIKQRFNSMR